MKKQMTKNYFIFRVLLLISCVIGIVSGIAMLDNGKPIGAVFVPVCILGAIINCFELFQKVYPYLPEKEKEKE